MVQKETMALLALPAHSCSWLPPCAPKLFELLLDLGVAVGFGVNVARVAYRPFGQLGGLSRTPCAPNMATLLASGGGWRDEQAVALVAGAPDSLLGGLVGDFAP